MASEPGIKNTTWEQTVTLVTAMEDNLGIINCSQ